MSTFDPDKYLRDEEKKYKTTEPDEVSSSATTQFDPSQYLESATAQFSTGLQEPIQGMATGAAIKGAFGSPETRVTSPVGPVKPTLVNPGPITQAAGEVADLAKIGSKITPGMVTDVFKRPLTFLGELPGAFAERYLGSANMNKTFGEMAKGVGQALINPANLRGAATGLGVMALAPENIIAAPYQMAAYEQERIRQNPNAPLTNKNYFTGNQVVQDTLEFNPFAQMVRGEAATQGQAGAANRRQAIAGQQYGGLTQEQQQMLEQDRIDQAIRRKAAQKVLGPVIPQGR